MESPYPHPETAGDDEPFEIPLLGRIDELEAKAREIDREVRHFVRRNPTVAVAGALALGFVIGKVLR